MCIFSFGREKHGVFCLREIRLVFQGILNEKVHLCGGCVDLCERFMSRSFSWLASFNIIKPIY